MRNVVKRVPPDLLRRAHARLLMIDGAESLADVRASPGNRLEKLVGGRDGQWSIRVNDQWRICFRWNGKNAHDVEFCDYH